jgi:hypothetical protein
MLKSLLPIMMMFFVAPASASAGESCGESFCLPAEAKLQSKKTPVHDFNLYGVEWQGNSFTIYEGNHPQSRAEASKSPLTLPLDKSATLRVLEGRGSVLIKIGEEWPTYLDVMGPCGSGTACAAARFAEKLRRR